MCEIHPEIESEMHQCW